MTTLREVAQQALEFCESVHGGCTDSNDGTVEAITIWCPELIEALRAALKQEEEASAWLAERKEYWRKEKEKMQATNALRAALAQPAEPVQEPAAWVSPNALAWELYQSEKVLKLTRTRQEEYGFTEPLYTAPPQHAEPVEPVAWMYRDSWGTMKLSQVTPPPVGAFPVYTAPPQRKTLTKESLLYIYNQLPNWGMDMDSLPQGLEKFARAVERAHGIKE